MDKNNQMIFSILTLHHTFSIQLQLKVFLLAVGQKLHTWGERRDHQKYYTLNTDYMGGGMTQQCENEEGQVGQVRLTKDTPILHFSHST